MGRGQKHRKAEASLSQFGFFFGPAPDYAVLERLWSDLERRASPSFFTSWTWVGCEFENRYPEPYLLRVVDGEELVALALFNLRRAPLRFPALYLGASGLPDTDSVFVEHNGPLLARLTPAITPDIFRQLVRFIDQGWLGCLVDCPGVSEHVYLAAQAAGLTFNVIHRNAPYRDLAALRMSGSEFLSALSANSRYQLRRSQRSYERSGLLRVDRAQSETEALKFLRSLILLHEAHWRRRGWAGAFSAKAIQFHQALIARAMPRGEVDLLRISTGKRVVGYLLNFVKNNVVHNYQSGFNYEDATVHEKPGLTSHHMAVQYYLNGGRVDRYDFLAGEDRYKLTLSDKFVPLTWFRFAASSPSLVAISYRAMAKLQRSSAGSLLAYFHNEFPYLRPGDSWRIRPR